MNLENAKLAGTLAERIAARLTKIDDITSAMKDGWSVCNIRIVGPDGNEKSLILETLDVDTSKQALGFALQVYQTQLQVLQAQLDAL